MRIGRFEIGGKIAPQTLAVVQGFIHRAQPSSCEDSAWMARRNVARSSFAFMRNERSEPGTFAQNPGRIRARNMNFEREPLTSILSPPRGEAGFLCSSIAFPFQRKRAG